MAKLTWNAFVNTYQRRYGLTYIFDDYFREKKSAAKAKQLILMRDGRALPSPYSIVSAIAMSKCKGNYAVKPFNAYSIVLILSDICDGTLLSSVWLRGDGNLFHEKSTMFITMSDHLSYAIMLGLL